MPPFSQEHFGILYRNGFAIHNGYRASNGDVDATASWKVVLSPGTYSLDLLYVAWPDAGVMSWTLNGDDIGNIDGYDAGGQFDQIASLDGIHVGDGDVQTLTVKIASKSPGSSGYAAYLQGLQLRRTA
jgi:hypothetical protein